MKIRRVHYRMLICCSVARSCLTLCDPIDCSTTGFLVLHHFLEFVQTYVHWFGDTIQPYLSSVVPFFFQSFPASGSFLVSQFFTSGGQSIGPSASASVLPMSIQGWFPLGLIWFDLAVWGTLKSLIQHHNLNASVLRCYFMLQLSDPYMTTGKS